MSDADWRAARDRILNTPGGGRVLLDAITLVNELDRREARAADLERMTSWMRRIADQGSGKSKAWARTALAGLSGGAS